MPSARISEAREKLLIATCHLVPSSMTRLGLSKACANRIGPAPGTPSNRDVQMFEGVRREHTQ
jgi:hypothetical protein